MKDIQDELFIKNYDRINGKILFDLDKHISNSLNKTLWNNIREVIWSGVRGIDNRIFAQTKINTEL